MGLGETRAPSALPKQVEERNPMFWADPNRNAEWLVPNNHSIASSRSEKNAFFERGHPHQMRECLVSRRWSIDRDSVELTNRTSPGIAEEGCKEPRVFQKHASHLLS